MWPSQPIGLAARGVLDKRQVETHDLVHEIVRPRDRSSLTDEGPPVDEELGVPARRTPIDRDELRAALSRDWHELVAADVPSDAVSILIAHTALETGRWDDTRGTGNLGGIKASASEPHTYGMSAADHA